MFVSWHPYFQLTQNKLQCSKNRTGNAVNLISKPWNKRFCTYLGKLTSNRRKITSNVLKNRTNNVVNLISIPANKGFYLYLGIRTSNSHKITNVLNNEQIMPYTRFQSLRLKILLLSWHPYIESTQNNIHYSKNRTHNAIHQISKLAYKIFSFYLGNVPPINQK